MQLSRLSAKGQITIPRQVRETLKLKPGDMIAYEMQNGVVTLRRVEPFDSEFHKALSATLDEWAAPQDDEAFRNL